jgi:signal transduction histidine kinase
MDVPVNSSWKLSSPLPALISALLVAIVCYQADKLVYVLGIPPDHIASFWPPTPFLIAALLLTSRKIWPLLVAAGLAGMALSDIRNGVPASFEVWITLGNLVDVLVALAGIRLLFTGVPRLNSLQTLAKYLAVAVILPPFISSLVGSSGSVPGTYWLQWRLWFFADALAFLTVMPAILSWVSEDGRAWLRKPGKCFELAILLTSLVLCSYFAFTATGQTDSPALLYSLVPLLLWAALRLGIKGVSTSIIVIILMASWGAARDLGPFTGRGPLNNALSLQLFLFFAAIPFMVLAVLVEEEKRTQQELADGHAQLTEAQRMSQLGSWHWDSETDKVTWSEELYKIAGRDPWLPPPDFKDLEQNYIPESWARLQAAVKESLLTGRGYELDLEIIRPDGTTRWIMARGEAQKLDAGRTVHLHGTAKDITERKRAEEAIAGMGRKLIEAQEQERARIARDLHDDVGQRLALLAVELNRMRDFIPDSAADLLRHVDDLEKQASEMSTDVHTLSHELHSRNLEYLGIVSAVRSFCKEYGDKYKADVNFAHEGVPENVPKEISVCLFRVLQESLQNALKHSEVRHFDVRLEGSSEEIHLTVRDSGIGFDPESTTNTRGLGLISMRERVNIVKGTFVITSRPQCGTEVSVRVPLSAGIVNG